MNDVDFKTTICHSPEDTWVTLDVVPPMPFPNTNVTMYQPILPTLAPQGDHPVAQFFCQIGMLSTFQFGNDRPNIVSPLSDPSTCNPPMPTEAPSGPFATQDRSSSAAGHGLVVPFVSMVLLGVAVLAFCLH